MKIQALVQLCQTSLNYCILTCTIAFKSAVVEEGLITNSTPDLKLFDCKSYYNPFYPENNFFVTFLISIIHFVAHSQSKNYIDQPYIEVSGYTDSLVIPNEIYIKIYVSKKDTRDKIFIEVTE